MTSQLSLVNKLILIAIAIAALAKVKLLFPPNLKKLSSIDNWEVLEIISGDRIIVNSSNEKLTIHLCSIASNYFEQQDESKRYLQSLIEQGKLRIDFLNKDDGIFFADVFVRLKPDYQQEIYLNQEMVDKDMATIDTPRLCPDTVFKGSKQGT